MTTRRKNRRSRRSRRSRRRRGGRKYPKKRKHIYTLKSPTHTIWRSKKKKKIKKIAVNEKNAVNKKIATAET